MSFPAPAAKPGVAPSRGRRPFQSAVVVFGALFVAFAILLRSGDAIARQHGNLAFWLGRAGFVGTLFSGVCLLCMGVAAGRRRFKPHIARPSRNTTQPHELEPKPLHSPDLTSARDVRARTYRRLILFFAPLGVVAAAAARVMDGVLGPAQPHNDWGYHPAASTVVAGLLAFLSFGAALLVCIVYAVDAIVSRLQSR
jgi:hypothetical protein